MLAEGVLWAWVYIYPHALCAPVCASFQALQPGAKRVLDGSIPAEGCMHCVGGELQEHRGQSGEEVKWHCVPGR